MAKLLKKMKSESGQSIVLFAVALIVVLGLAALVLDVGMVKLAESEMQNAADAAALAAVSNLPDITAATNTALVYGQLNGAEMSDIIVTTPYDGDSSKIEIVCQKTVDFTFANALGFKNTVVSARAVAAKGGGSPGGAFDYAIFSGSSTQMSRIGGNCYVEGDIHGNNDYQIHGASGHVTGSIEAVYNLYINGAKTTVDGSVQAANISISGANITTGPRIEVSAPYVEMPDLTATTDEAIANAAYNYMGYTGFHGASTYINDSIYVDGMLQVTGSNFTSTGAIMASGDIMITGAKMTLTGDDGVALYSENGSIYLYGSNPEIHGLVYAPNGNIVINGAQSTVYGQLVAQTVTLDGANTEIYFDDSYLDIIGFGGDENGLAE